MTNNIIDKSAESPISHPEAEKTTEKTLFTGDNILNFRNQENPESAEEKTAKIRSVLKERYTDASNEELDFWLEQICWETYNELTEEQKENRLKTFDFREKWPYSKKLPPNSDLICGLEAADIIRKGRNLEEPTEPEWLIMAMLFTITPYKSKTPDSYGNHIVKQTPLVAPSGYSDHLTSFYELREIEKLASSPVPFIRMEDLLKRNSWNRHRLKEVKILLEDKCYYEKELQVFDFDHFYTGYFNKDGEWIFSSSYGTEARALIQNGKAIFSLTEIEKIERSLFGEGSIEPTVKASTLKDGGVEPHFNKIMELIEKGEVSIHIKQADMAEKILKDFQSEGKHLDLTEKQKKSRIATICKALGDLNYKDKMNTLKLKLEQG